MNVFEALNEINVNDRIEEKEGLSYLSWVWAWSEVKKRYPDASYKIFKDENGRPFVYDEAVGYMVFTSVTIQGETLEMWLPVMNGANKAMKAHPYKYSTKYGDKSVEAASMTDINKALMRCLTKNLAMFGLGLYIYAGEDVPAVEKGPTRGEKLEKLKKKFAADNIDVPAVCAAFKVKNMGELTDAQLDNISENYNEVKQKCTSSDA